MSQFKTIKARFIRTTTKAVLMEINNQIKWIPYSIQKNSIESNQLGYYWITIPLWFFTKNINN